MTPGLVSVVIPTRNRWALLDRALATVLGQRGVELEAIVIDDGSINRPPALPAMRDKRVRVVRHEPSRGVAAARNRGIAESRGEWVAFLDDDDLWAPTKLQSQLRACVADDAHLSFTGVLLLDTGLVPKAVIRARRPRHLEHELLAYNVIGSPSSVMVRRSVLEQVGGFDGAFSVFADWDLWLRLAPGTRAAVCEEPLTGYVLHDANMHLENSAIGAEYRRLKTKHKARASAHGREIGGPDALRWIAFASRRSGLRRQASAAFFFLGVRHRRVDDLGRSLVTLLGESAVAYVGHKVNRRSVTDGLESAAWLTPLREAQLESASFVR